MKQMTIDQTMDAAAGTIPRERGSAKTDLKIKISSRFLLGIYAIVPVCLVAMVLDKFLWGGFLFRALPTNPQSFFIFQLLFGTPHIIASSVILATNTDYLRTYRWRVAVFTLIILLFFGIGNLFISYRVFLALVGSATVIHVIKQQVGVGKGLCRLSSRIYDAWGWALIVFGSILYYALFMGASFSPSTASLVHGALWGVGGLIFVLTLVCHRRIKTGTGRLYLWANALMVLQSGLFYAQGYSFLAILGPRLVHDITAFTFYVAHDVNRHGTEPENLLYRLASKLGLGVFWVCPAVAVLLTFLIGRFLDPLAGMVVEPVLGFNLPYAASFVIVGYLGLLHYYTESFTWRQGSPYRRQIVLT
ncbi:MAG: hypothetical protein R2747_22335 [Pyrinomonadaceae bacterium]